MTVDYLRPTPDHLAPTRDFLASRQLPRPSLLEPVNDGSLAAPEVVCRAMLPGALRFREDGAAGPVIEGRMMPYGEFTEINSAREGHFLERFAPGSLTKTLTQHLKRIRVLFDHGHDRSIGSLPIATFDGFEERDDGVHYRATLIRGVPELLVEGLRSGLYGSSVRFNATKVDRVRAPRRSAHNPNGLEERTIREARVFEFSVTPFPAYPDATAQVVA